MSKYLHSGDRIGIACHLCEPPNRKECGSCKRRVKPKYPAREVWINDTKYVIAEREGKE